MGKTKCVNPSTCSSYSVNPLSRVTSVTSGQAIPAEGCLGRIQSKMLLNVRNVYSPLVNFQNKYFSHLDNSSFVNPFPGISSVFNWIVKPTEWCSGSGCSPRDAAHFLQMVRNIPFTFYVVYIINKPFNISNNLCFVNAFLGLQVYEAGKLICQLNAVQEGIEN